jgi:hypothetical protein
MPEFYKFYFFFFVFKFIAITLPIALTPLSVLPALEYSLPGVRKGIRFKVYRHLNK